MVILSGASLSAHASDKHACQTTNMLSGIVERGTPLMFWLKGSVQSYGLSHLVPVSADYARGQLQVGQRVEIYLSDMTPDRYGRLTGQVFVTGQDGDNERWLQGELLKDKSALYSGQPALAACRREMLAMEKMVAQKPQQSENDFRYRADQIAQLTDQAGRFVVVSGKVISVGDRKTRLYLNFGQKWSQDFTALIAKKGKSAFTGDITRLQKLKGSQVSLRGVIELSGGPMIRLIHEAQVEFDGG